MTSVYSKSNTTMETVATYGLVRVRWKGCLCDFDGGCKISNPAGTVAFSQLTVNLCQTVTSAVPKMPSMLQTVRKLLVFMDLM